VTGDARAWERMLASMRTEFGHLPETSDGGRCLELDGVLATIVPAVPERSVANSVIYETEDALAAALPELARAYDHAGVVAWTVWVPRHHERARELLGANGHLLDADPAAMIAPADEIEPPRPGDPEPDPHPRREDLGRVNDLAYGTGDAFQRLMGTGAADPEHVYVARVDGEAAATVVTSHHGGDCAIWWVATVPEARGRGLAPGLMRRAIADGRDRGCDVTTLQATKVGQPVYERIGYRAFGVVEMWERRKPAA
jgi:ribosomal protein S18 acetylase RimI-like enzyme